MPNRIIKESICTSDSIDSLSIEAERLFYRLIVNCDDFGTLDARLPIIKSKCFPLKSSDITDNQLISWLTELEAQQMIFFYENSDHQYLKMSSWERHQQIRAKRSKCPLPGDDKSNRISFDIICNQMITDVTVIQSNPIQSNPNPIQSIPKIEILESEQKKPKKLKAESTDNDDMFSKFWAAYPKKKSKGDAEKAWKTIKPDNTLLTQMLKTIEDAKKSAAWKKDGGQWIPYPGTWLRAKGWADEVEVGIEESKSKVTYDIDEYENSDVFSNFER